MEPTPAELAYYHAIRDAEAFSRANPPFQEGGKAADRLPHARSEHAQAAMEAERFRKRLEGLAEGDDNLTP
jgi:hypothetical protein